MQIAPFEMERWQSVWENRVELNVSESGVEKPEDVKRFLALGVRAVLVGTALTRNGPTLARALAEAGRA